MKDLLTFLDNGAVTLDLENQVAVATILRGAWSSSPGSARDIMRDRLESPAGD